VKRATKRLQRRPHRIVNGLPASASPRLRVSA
jgi:hypothetical protein